MTRLGGRGRFNGRVAADVVHTLVLHWSLEDAFDEDYAGWLRTDVDDTAGEGNEDLWPTINSPEELARHRLRIRVQGDRKYKVLGSGSVERLGSEAVPTWSLDTLREVASYTVMLAVVPARDVKVDRFDVAGIPVTITSTHKKKKRKRARRIVERTLPRLIRDFGPFPMPELQILLIDWEDGMEYYGATTTGLGSLEHELVHMYWGCSALGRSWRDTWIDEALAVWWTEREDLEPLDEDFESGMVGGRATTGRGFRHARLRGRGADHGRDCGGARR